MIKTFLFDQLSAVALYGEIKKAFPNEITMLFESVVTSEDGNFSFIAIGAKERLQFIDNYTIYEKESKKQVLNIKPFEFLKDYYSKLNKEKYQNYAKKVGFKFVDGFIGYLAYDLVKIFEPSLKSVMDNLEDTLDTPDLDLIRPKIIVGFSHKSSELTIIDLENKYFDIVNRIIKIISKSHMPQSIKPILLSKEGKFYISKDKFIQIVNRAKKNIKSGDIFQIVLSNRYTQKAKVEPLSFYRVLRAKNPSPYLFLLDFEDFSICGSSPEVMVRLTDNEILLRPIAGTRKRGKTAQEDFELEKELLSDPKECAEHLMLIDLGRNDVGRVAKVGTVKVPNIMRVERYSHVMHIVSDVIGELDNDKDMFDLFKATFTAGTMSGAPKIKAMELIAKFEGLKRGFYSGSVGYFSFTGDMDSAITIRTALIKEDTITLQAGAGIVADSIAELEELEVRNKLGALIATLKDMTELKEEHNLILLKEINDE